MTEWRQGRPVKCGYYLGAHKRGSRWIVSELWFNPDSVGSGWWTTRGYLGQDRLSGCAGVDVEVMAWMPMPVFTEGSA